MARALRDTRRLGRKGGKKEKKYPGGVRVGGGILLTSLNMFQHPLGYTLHRVSLGRSIPMPVRQSTLPPLSTSPFPLPLSHTPATPAPCTTADRPPPPFPPSLPRAFYRRLCVLRQWQTDLNLPLRPYPPTLDSLVLPQPSRPPSFQ